MCLEHHLQSEGKGSYRDLSLVLTIIELVSLKVGCWCHMFRLFSWNARNINNCNKRALLKKSWGFENLMSFVIKKQNWRKSYLMTFVVFRTTTLLIMRHLRLSDFLWGVLVTWDKSVFHFVFSFCGNFSITCILHMVKGGLVWAFIRVYRPHTRVDKLRFWEELGHIKYGWHGPWCIGEDFNEILYP